MKKITVITFLLVTIILLLLQSIYVISAQQDESYEIKKETVMPAPVLLAL